MGFKNKLEWTIHHDIDFPRDFPLFINFGESEKNKYDVHLISCDEVVFRIHLAVTLGVMSDRASGRSGSRLVVLFVCVLAMWTFRYEWSRS